MDKLLHEMLVKLTNKIDSLEHKIDTLTQYVEKHTQNSDVTCNQKNVSENQTITNCIPNFVPTTNFDDWIQTFTVTREDVNFVFRNTVLEGFKHFIQDMFSKRKNDDPIVFCGKPKTLYIFQKYVIVDQDGQASLRAPLVLKPGSLGLLCPDTEETEYLIKGEPESENIENFENKWIPFSDCVVQRLIECVWRKMLEFYFTSPSEPGVDETVRDINKKKLIDMRKNLSDKNTKEIERFIIKLFR
jgi:hypothetical protein